jgi:hypothetical protein
VGRHAPERFFADRPDSVEDVVDEAAPSLDGLGEDELGQTDAAAERDGLEAAAVAVADEIEEHRGLGDGPIGAEVLLGRPDVGLADGRRDLLPARGVPGLRIGMPVAGPEENGLEDLGGESPGEKIGLVLGDG